MRYSLLLILQFFTTTFSFSINNNRVNNNVLLANSNLKQISKLISTSLVSLSILLPIDNKNILLSPLHSQVSVADDQIIEKVPLYNKKSSEVQPYVDISRGFKLLRPFGYNEFDGAGGGYLVKFASLFDVDENIVIGSSPASADKTSITDFGSLDTIASKLLKKRGGALLSSSARETDGIVFYQFKFENPLDKNLPRIGPQNRLATKQIELYQLCVSKGKLWSVQATSNDQLFPEHEQRFNIALLSFIPRL